MLTTDRIFAVGFSIKRGQLYALKVAREKI